MEERHHLSQHISITATLLTFYKERSCWRMLVSVFAAAFCRGKARFEAGRLEQPRGKVSDMGPLADTAVKRSDRDRPGRCEHRQATWSSSVGNHGMRPVRLWIWAVCARREPGKSQPCPAVFHHFLSYSCCMWRSRPLLC